MFNLDSLEFEKIIKKITKYAHLDSTIDRLESLSPSINYEEIETNLALVDEALILIERIQSFEIMRFELDGILSRLRLYADLTAKEFFDILKLLDVCISVRSYYAKINDLKIELNYLNQYFSKIEIANDLKREISRIITPDGLIYDDASSTLKRIRTNINRLESKIRDRIDSFIRSESDKLTDNVITIRNGHLVVPVKSDYKNQVKGIIQDESASGGTVFIEPLSCLELNNEITSLKVEEEKEIIKILHELSIFASGYHDSLALNYDIIKELDFIYAKAAYAKEINATKPIITDNEIELINARHPLISKETVVPNTIKFDDYKMIIITGPNTGGKTVVLKTLGLLSLMCQSGILIPVDEGSKTIIFDSIYTDIGDEQSIEMSLSTFSSHMKKIVSILDEPSLYGSLVLLDEVGSGTDPKEGASLAISILDYLNKRGIYTVATTHYPEVKVYAYDKINVLNASVEFDVDTLKPTFKLKLGVSGTSNAFLISKRLGLNEEVLNKAKSLNQEFDTETSDLIKKLEYESAKLENKNKELNDIIQKNNELSVELHEKELSLKQKENKLIEQLNNEKQKILRETQEEAFNIIEELKKISKNAEIKQHEINNLKAKIDDLYHEDKEIKKINHKEIQVGDYVKVIKYNQVGQVTKIDKNNKYEVLLGSLTSRFNKDEIEYTEITKHEVTVKTISKVKSESLSLELDLRGKRYEEAMIELENFVDRCLLNNVEFAYIIHGFGTFAIRNGVLNYIKTHKIIKTHRPGNEKEGGNGVTIIYFK